MVVMVLSIQTTTDKFVMLTSHLSSSIPGHVLPLCASCQHRTPDLSHSTPCSRVARRDPAAWKPASSRRRRPSDVVVASAEELATVPTHSETARERRHRCVRRRRFILRRAQDDFRVDQTAIWDFEVLWTP